MSDQEYFTKINIKKMRFELVVRIRAGVYLIGQRKLAEKLNIHETYLYRIVNKPETASLEKLIEIYNKTDKIIKKLT
jgi:hypothetical protein